MSIIGQQDVSNLYNSAETLKGLVGSVGSSLQNVINYLAVIQTLPSYAGSSSAGDKNFITALNTSATNILNTINGLSWPF